MARNNTVEIILSAKDKASRATKQAFSNVSSSAKSAFSAIASASAVAAGAMATVSAAVGKIGLEYNAMMEQSEVAWKTLLGSAEEAQSMLKQISDFTKATPFETEHVDMMAKYMHNAGLEGQKLFDELLRVSDVSSAFAIPASEAKEMARQMSQVRQAGVAYTEDLNILQDRGVPIFKAIAEQQGIMVKDVKKMASEGKISSEIYVEAFNSIAKGVEGASEAQSKTFNGMLSTLKDNIKIFAGQINEGVFERIKEYLPIVIGAIEDLSASFEKGGWTQVMKDFLPEPLVSAITTGIDSIKTAFEGLKDQVDPFVESFINLKEKIDKQNWEGIGNSIGSSLLIALQSMADFGAQIGNWVVEQIKKVDWAQIGKASVAATAGFVLGFVDGLLDPVVWWEIISKYWQEIVWIIVGIVAAPAKLLNPILDAVRKIPLAGKLGAWLIQSIHDMGRKVLAPITKFLGDMGRLFFTSFLDEIGRVGQGLFPLFRTIIDNAVQKGKAFKQKFYDLAGGFMIEMGSAIGKLGPKQVVSSVKKLISNIDLALSLFVKRAQTIGSNILSGLGQGFKVAYEVAIAPIVEIGKAIGKTLTGLSSKALTWGKDLVNGFVRGIGSKLESAKKKAVELADGVTSSIKNFFQIQSPSKLMKIYGQFVGQGLIDGIDDKKTEAERKAEEISQKVKEGIDKYITRINGFGDSLMSALRKRYDKEEQLQLESLRSQTENLRKATDEKIKLYDQEYAAKLKTLNEEEAARIQSIQDQIDGINEKTEEEEKALKEQEYQTRITELKKKLTATESAKERAEIQNRLNEEVAKHERELLLENRKEKIEALRIEMDNVRKQAEQKKDELRKEYENNKENAEKILANQVNLINKEMEHWQNHFAKLKEEESIQAEARKMLLKGNQDEMISILAEYEPDWQDAGRSFGEKLIEGLNSAKESMRSTIGSLLTGVSNAQTASGVLSNPDYGKGAATGAEAKANINRLKSDSDFVNSEKERAKQVIANRKAAGMDTSLQEKYLNSLDKYHEGGEVTKLGPKEVPAILREGEIVVNPDGLRKESGGSPIVLQFHFSNTVFTGSRDFKRFVQTEIAPAVSQALGQTVLRNKKV